MIRTWEHTIPSPNPKWVCQSLMWIQLLSIWVPLPLTRIWLPLTWVWLFSVNPWHAQNFQHVLIIKLICSPRSKWLYLIMLFIVLDWILIFIITPYHYDDKPSGLDRVTEMIIKKDRFGGNSRVNIACSIQLCSFVEKELFCIFDQQGKCASLTKLKPTEPNLNRDECIWSHFK